MSARTDLAEALVELLPGFDVQSYYAVPTELDAIAAGGKPRLMLWRSTIAPGQALGLRRCAFVVWLIVPEVDPQLVDDVLDDYLEVVLAALDTTPRLGWETAERGVLEESYAGYRITLTFHTSKIGS